MDKEPTLVINFVESLAAIAAAFGVQLSTGQHDALILIGGAIFAVGNIVFALWNRQSVFSPKKVNELLAAGASPPVEPPAGAPSAG